MYSYMMPFGNIQRTINEQQNKQPKDLFQELIDIPRLLSESKEGRQFILRLAKLTDMPLEIVLLYNFGEGYTRTSANGKASITINNVLAAQEIPHPYNEMLKQYSVSLTLDLVEKPGKTYSIHSTFNDYTEERIQFSWKDKNLRKDGL